MKIVLSGSMGRLPVGGYAWMDMQWLAGFQALGHDVWYIEDAGESSWVYDWDSEDLTQSLDYPAGFVGHCLSSIGLGANWSYRTDDERRGMTHEAVATVCAEADLLIVHGVPLAAWRPEYQLPRRTVFVDVDPAFTQIRLASGDDDLAETVGRCDRLFTIAQRMGQPDCTIPNNGLEWVPTVPPIALQHWPPSDGSGATHFTCVMQWRGHHDVEHQGIRYGQKDAEFPRFMALPTRTSQPLRLALTGAEPRLLEEHGWEVVPGWEVSRTPWSYQQFIRRSRGEFSVAKHGYVRSRGGWFSDRSLCYLATGRPVVVEDTGLDWLPTGKGIVTFGDIDGARDAIEAVNDDYEAHAAAARCLAAEYFDAAHVLSRLLDQVA
ncbi:MAG: glycosyltransferase family 1 protein [Actinomycetota bacterium]|nr:glycosyltransferase family 1 protein [Actinomycetota bacterium]